MKQFLHSKLLTSLLVLIDAIVFVAVWLCSYWLRGRLVSWGVQPINALSNYLVPLSFYLPLWLGCIWYHGLYDTEPKRSSFVQAGAILKTCLFGTILSLALAYLLKPFDLGRAILLITPVLYFIYLMIGRAILRKWQKRQLFHGEGMLNVAIIGLSRTARRVAERIKANPIRGYKLVGFIDPYPKMRMDSLNGSPVLGTTKHLVKILKEYDIDMVYLAAPALNQDKAMNLIVQCEPLGVEFKIASNYFGVITNRVKVDEVDDMPIIQLRNDKLHPISKAMKRLIDIILSLTLIILTAPLILVLAIIIKLDSRGPVFFRQKRIGLHGVPFMMYKLRTMTTDTDAYADAPTDADDPRITRCGRWMRHLSLDEFPQLINVLKGEMSMVGPRPEMPFIVEKYEPWQRRRLDVKPGITGYWQIIGRKNLPLPLNIEYDFYYIKNQGLLFDIVILIRTIPAVLFGRGAF